MRCVELFLVAVVTALLFLTGWVEPKPAYDTAPVALLLPNGTIVMVPGRDKNSATKTSNEQYQNYHSKNSGAKHRSQPQKSISLKLLEVDNQKQLIHPVSTSSLLDSVQDLTKKSCTGSTRNIANNTNQISSEACRQLRNVKMYNPRKSISVALGPDDDLNRENNQKCWTSARSSREYGEVCQTHTSDKSTTMSHCESFNMHHDIPTKNEEFSFSRSQARGNVFSEQCYDTIISNNNKRTPENSQATTNQATSDQRIYFGKGNSDGDARVFESRNARRDLILSADYKKYDPSANSNQQQAILNAGDSAENPRYFTNCGGLCSSDFNLKKGVSNDHSERFIDGNGATLTSSTPWKDYSFNKGGFKERTLGPSAHQDNVYSNSGYSHRKGNLAGFRLNLLKGRENFMDDVLLEYETQNTHGYTARSDSPNNKKTFFIHDRLDCRGTLQNDSSRGRHSRVIDNDSSCFKDPSYLSWGELKTPAKSKGSRSTPIKTDFKELMKERRDKPPEFEDYTEGTDQRTSRKAGDGPKYSCRRPTGTGFANDLESDANLPQSGRPFATTGNNYPSKPTRNSNLALKDPRFHSTTIQTREKDINVEIPRGNGENRCRTFENGTEENCDDFIDRINDKSLEEAFWENNRPAMRGIFASHLPRNGNGIWFTHGQQPENIQSINTQPRIIQHPKQRDITAIPSNSPAIVPHILHKHEMKSGSPHESFKRPSMLLNKYPEFQYVESPTVLTLQTRLSPTLSIGSMTHCTSFPWMGLPIHHPPMDTGDRRYFRFLSSCPLPLRTTSFASFVKDEYDHWWLIHYETII